MHQILSLKQYCLPAVLLFFCVQSSFAQVTEGQTPGNNATNTLKEVVISSMHINDSLLNAPAAIGILSRGDLQRNNNTDISTAINTIAGVYMQTASYNTNRISIRGIGARTPYGTNKIRAFYGNIPLTSGDSETTIEDIDIENISQVEIIKGPLSSVYGAGLGGAILVSPNLNGPAGNSLRVGSVFGSYGLVKNTVNYSFDSKSSSLTVSYHKLETDGWRQNSAYNREGVTMAGELFRKANSKLTYFSNYTYMKAYIPSSIDKTAFDTNPRSAAFTWKSAKGYEQYDSYLGGLSYDWKLTSSISNSTSVYINHKEADEPRPFDILLQNTTGYGARTQFTGTFSSKAKFVVGFEYFKDNYKGRTFENLYEDNNGLGSLQGLQLTGSQQHRTFYNAFAQFRVQFSKKLELQAGVNLNKTAFDLDNSFPVAAINSEQYSYDAIWSPQVSVLFKPTVLQTFYISASRGFSLPSVEETLTASGTVNSDIKPESGYNFEIGGKLFSADRKLHAEIAVYRMQIQDLLVAQRIGDDQYIGVNAGETLHQGIEITADYNWQLNQSVSLLPYFSASIGEYKFEDFNDNGNDFSGNKLTGVPANKVNAGITVSSILGIYLSADYRFTAKMPLNDSNSIYTDAFKILDLKLGYRIEIIKNINAHISAGINNLTNEHYASMILPNATGFGTTLPRYYYPGMPVNYYGNVSVSYQF